MRTFYVDLPEDYDSSQPYPVVFLFHPLGGNASQARTMYRVRENFPNAIYVSPQGIDNGWANTGGRDIAFTTAMMADIEGKYCVDTGRYFSTGFSYGGIMSFAIMCNMADRFRAIAPMAGNNFGGSCSPAGPLAAWISHGSADTVVDPDGAAEMRDILLELNGCDSTSTPVDPSPCVAYSGCDTGYPVVWCLVEGQGHAIPSYSPTAIAEFFQQF
jgi:poly(3-hydroxybutyrate) depolymerase